MASRRKNGAMGGKRKQIASSSDDEKNQSGIPIEDELLNEFFVSNLQGPEQRKVPLTFHGGKKLKRNKLLLNTVHYIQLLHIADLQTSQ